MWFKGTHRLWGRLGGAGCGCSRGGGCGCAPRCCRYRPTCTMAGNTHTCCDHSLGPHPAQYAGVVCTHIVCTRISAAAVTTTASCLHAGPADKWSKSPNSTHHPAGSANKRITLPVRHPQACTLVIRGLHCQQQVRTATVMWQNTVVKAESAEFRETHQ